MWKANIYVTYKDSVFEPQGATVKESLKMLGFNEVQKVKIGKFIELEFSSDKSKDLVSKEVTAMCEKLLANTVIEKYSFDLKKEP